MRLICLVTCMFALAACGVSVPSDLTSTNVRVNNSITYVSDGTDDSDDNWQTPSETLARGKGDCEDYTLLKSFLLPSYKTQHIFFGQQGSTIHAVLLVDNQFILDNIRDEVTTKQEFLTRYKYLGQVPIEQVPTYFKHKFN